MALRDVAAVVVRIKGLAVARIRALMHVRSTCRNRIIPHWLIYAHPRVCNRVSNSWARAIEGTLPNIYFDGASTCKSEHAIWAQAAVGLCPRAVAGFGW